MQVLVLNSSYEFLGITNWKNAISAVYTNKVTVEEEYDRIVKSPSIEMKVPAVIRLRNYVHVIYDRISYVSYSKKNVIYRDNFTCQYCNKKCSRNQVTIDHVVPKSKGGLSTWENTVTACKSCNNIKNDKTVSEAKLSLVRLPRKPRGFSQILRIKLGEIHVLWEKYIL